jgi:hypothetical protein
MDMRRFHLALLTLLALPIPLQSAIPLKPETVAAWEHYLQIVDLAVQASSAAGATFLQLEKTPNQLHEVRQGKMVVSQVKRKSAPDVPHGLVHDWIGTMFIPHATLANVFAVTRSYDKYPRWYGPTITHAHLIERTPNQDRFAIRYVRHVLFVTAVLDAEYQIRYVQVSPTRWYSINRSISLHEVDQYAKGADRKLDDDGRGYLWRAYTLTKYEEKDGGVYLEQESIGLSRPIPTSLRWIVEPVVKRLARELLEKPLEQTRQAILQSEGKHPSYKK